MRCKRERAETTSSLAAWRLRGRGRGTLSLSHLWEIPAGDTQYEAREPGVSMWTVEGKSTIQRTWKSGF